MVVGHSEQLARAVRERREQLSLSMAAAEEAGGPSQPTLARIENGQSPPPRPITLAKLDKALRWRSGTAARVYAGDTTALHDADCSDTEWPPAGISVDDLARLLHAAAEVVATPDFPPALAQGIRHAAADLVGDVVTHLAATRDAGDIAALTHAIQRLIVTSASSADHDADSPEVRAN